MRPTPERYSATGSDSPRGTLRPSVLPLGPMRSADFRVLSSLLLLFAGCSARQYSIPRPVIEDGSPDDSDASMDIQDAGAKDVGQPREDDAGEYIGDVLIYAHSGNTLYSFSPESHLVTTVGDFHLDDGSTPPNMLDLAINEAGEIYTVSRTALYRVDGQTAEVSAVGTLSIDSDESFNALTFLAVGEYRADRETLVGASNLGTYAEINTTTAAVHILGTYPDGWVSSGDLVSVEGLGTFATVKRDDFGADVLVQILFSRDGSSAITVKGTIQSATQGFTKIFGVGYWGRSVYGFTQAGELIQIDPHTGEAELVNGHTGASSFWGAGVTTQAPILY